MGEKANLVRQVCTFLLITSVITAGVFIWVYSSPKADTGILLWPRLVESVTSVYSMNKYCA